jgi:hypothetical protein
MVMTHDRTHIGDKQPGHAGVFDHDVRLTTVARAESAQTGSWKSMTWSGEGVVPEEDSW